MKIFIVIIKFLEKSRLLKLGIDFRPSSASMVCIKFYAECFERQLAHFATIILFIRSISHTARHLSFSCVQLRKEIVEPAGELGVGHEKLKAAILRETCEMPHFRAGVVEEERPRQMLHRGGKVRERTRRTTLFPTRIVIGRPAANVRRTASALHSRAAFASFLSIFVIAALPSNAIVWWNTWELYHFSPCLCRPNDAWSFTIFHLPSRL